MHGQLSPRGAGKRNKQVIEMPIEDLAYYMLSHKKISEAVSAASGY